MFSFNKETYTLSSGNTSEQDVRVETILSYWITVRMMEILRQRYLTIPAQYSASYELYAEDDTQDNYRAHQFPLNYSYKK